jgi:hydrogenase maturation protein HypF
MSGREMVLRRARGYAPLPIPAGTRSTASRISSAEGDAVEGVPTILAVGAHLKNSVALAVGDQIFLSQHIGDLETELANQAFRRVATDLPRIYDTTPEVIAADLHPDYLSTQFASERWPPVRPDSTAQHAGSETGASRIARVQHHIAHALSCMAENEVKLPALGVAWDGTGYGTDGTIWGGEFFHVTEESIDRVAHLRPFRLPGGDAAAKQPRRAAFGLLREICGENVCNCKGLATLAAFSETELAALQTMLDRGLNSPWCSSMGRLFDAVASLTGLRQQIRFEGQAAMELEFALEGCETNESYRFPLITRKNANVLDWSPMIGAILLDTKRGLSIGEISARFHNTLAEAIVAVAQQVGQTRVALSGGCFQNRYLLERAVNQLRARGFQPYWHQRVPTNDGGIALGQVVAARRELRGGGPPSEQPQPHPQPEVIPQMSVATTF